MLKDFDHGGYLSEGDGILDFSSNVNVLPLPSTIRKELMKEVSRKSGIYPDPFCSFLTEELAKRLAVKEDMILFGNGSTELIYLITKVLIFEPTFSEYRRASILEGAKIISKSLDENFCIFEFDSEPVDLLFLCHPNNPTGNFLINDIRSLFRLPAKYYVVDEAFIDFTGQKEKSFLSLLKRHENLIIVRSFTKFYPLAGLRIGYVFAAREIIKKLREAIPPWTVNRLAMKGALAFLKDEGFMRKTLDLVEKERNYLSKKLREAGFRVFPSVTNFLLFELKEGQSSKKVKTELLRKGILVRDFSNFSGLGERFIRVSVRKRGENRKLVEALKTL